ncbi:OLC1v1010125C1 [Oldenlandia corymbosa var. corymbosa]|uniref:Sulfotransferase n=1 Tax=Oldenlandia corymbosa var. corymbosa TaxID=529605 RepID=A0AAV1DR48_OLDCO|nr:OLC1v1010125C1 [Oldenlandia corymbosa var. corymbosa]
MADDICVFTKDSIVIRAPRRSPALLRTVVFAFLVVCSLYICSICLKQTNSSTKPSRLMNFEVVERPCHDNIVDRSQDPYLHYPRPKTFYRAECSCNPIRFFAILSVQRSGSGWFETLLNSHINVSSNGEIFSVKSRRENITSITETLDRVYNLDLLTSASKNECSAAVGFKWMLNQGLLEHHEEIVQYFNDKGVSVIFLFRRNLLRRMVSLLANSYDRYAKLLNGTHKSHVHSPEEAETLSSYKPVINLTSLTTELKQMEVAVSDALERFKSTRHMILFYEDLVQNRTKLQDVQDFLKLPQMELKSRQVKIHKGPLSEHIRNWEDVNKALKGTDYEKFLSSDR